LKTLKEISDELSVSKQSVYKRVKGSLSKSLENHFEIIDNISYVDEEGETIIRNAYAQDEKPGSIESENVSRESNPLNESLSKTIDLLREQLSVKDKQIEQLSESNKSLLQVLSQQQTLHAASISAKESLPEKSFTETEQTETQERETPLKKRRFPWLFKRN